MKQGMPFWLLLLLHLLLAFPPHQAARIDVIVTEHSTAILPCRFEPTGNQRVVWSKQDTTILTFNDFRVIEDARFSLERPSVKDWNIHIRNVRHLDQGVYTCTFSSNPTRIETVNLIVQDRAARIDVIVTEHSTAILPCSFEPTGNQRVVWRNQDTTTLTFNDWRITGDARISIERPSVEDWNLHIRNVRRSDQGVYTCTFISSLTRYKEVNLIVQEPTDPSEALRTERSSVDDENNDEEEHPDSESPIGGIHVVATKSNTALLPCRVESFQIHHVVWIYNSSPITINDMRLINDERISIERPSAGDWNLRIRNVSNADQGVYRCHATTSPVQWKDVTLTVQ